jgi:hypothetical protein
MADTKISDLTSYTPAVDTDVMPIVDTTLATTKKITWANVKATLKTYFDGLYLALSGGTMTGDIIQGENTSLQLDAALSADGKYCGITETGTIGETLVFGNVCYFKTSDSKWYLAKADAASTSGDVKLGMCLVAGNANAATTMLLYGKIRADSLFPTMTVSAPVHISSASGGAIVVAAPTATDSVTRRIGFGNTADELFFCPSPDYYTHT